MLTARTALAGMVLLILAPITYTSSASAAPSRATRNSAIQIISAQHRLARVVGDHFTYRLHIGNLGAAPTEQLIAHLNVASLTNDVYVDPEDWSSNRSVALAPIMPHSQTLVSWNVQAVNAGSFVVYAVVLPDGATSAGGGPLVVSPATHVTVAARRTLSAGGALPVAIAVPAVLAALLAMIRVRSRRAAR